MQTISGGCCWSGNVEDHMMMVMTLFMILLHNNLILITINMSRQPLTRNTHLDLSIQHYHTNIFECKAGPEQLYNWILLYFDWSWSGADQLLFVRTLSCVQCPVSTLPDMSCVLWRISSTNTSSDDFKGTCLQRILDVKIYILKYWIDGKWRIILPCKNFNKKAFAFKAR